MVGIIFPALTKAAGPKNAPRPGAFGHTLDTGQCTITSFDHLEQHGLKFSIQPFLRLINVVPSGRALAPLLSKLVLEPGEFSIAAPPETVGNRGRSHRNNQRGGRSDKRYKHLP